MGLKWFRARMTMSRVPKSTSSTPGFYRSMPQFDCDVYVEPIQPSTPRENVAVPSIHSVPTSPRSIAVNPMAALNSQGSETSIIRQDNGLEVSALNHAEESPDEDGIKIPRHLPRESIEILRSGSAESSPRQLIVKSRKAEFKKKARAPVPKASSNPANDYNRKFGTNDKGRSSDGSEIEI